MKDSEDDIISQDELILVEEKKKGFKLNKKKVKDSWKKMIQKIKKYDPNFQRYKKILNKLEDVHDDTQEIKLEMSELTLMIGKLMEGQKNIEKYMKKHLGSDWQKIANSWKDCKNGEISKGTFIKTAFSKIGKNFINIFL